MFVFDSFILLQPKILFKQWMLALTLPVLLFTSNDPTTCTKHSLLDKMFEGEGRQRWRKGRWWKVRDWGGDVLPPNLKTRFGVGRGHQETLPSISFHFNIVWESPWTPPFFVPPIQFCVPTLDCTLYPLPSLPSLLFLLTIQRHPLILSTFRACQT